MATKAGPLMVRHEIDGHKVLLPYDAILEPRRCGICGKFTNKAGKCPSVFTVEPGVYEHK